MTKKQLLSTLALLIGAAALAHAQRTPQITDSFPPANEVRLPDRSIDSGATGSVPLIAYNSNGRLLAAACADHVIRIWDARPGERSKGELVMSLRGHTKPILALAFSTTESNVLVSASIDQTVKVWDISSGKVLRSRNLQLLGGAITFRPGKEPELAESTPEYTRVWNYETGKLLRRLGLQTLSMAFRADGKVLVTGTEKGAVHAWDIETGKLVGALQASSIVISLAVNETHVIAGCLNGSVMAAKLDGSHYVSIKVHPNAVKAVAISPKGDQFATAGSDRVVRVWETDSARLLCLQQGHAADVLAVAFSPNGQKLASASEDGSVKYWTVPLPPLPAVDLAKIKEAVPQKATAAPKKPRRLLVFWRADAILHKAGVPAANHAIELMGKTTGAFEADFSRDYAVFDPNVLARYDAIVMNSTAHLAMPEDARKAYVDYVKGGGGVVGIHAAIDMMKESPDAAAVIGATFGGHPWGPSGTWAVKLDEPNHPLLRAWGGQHFKIRDEFYEMAAPYSRSDRRVLLTADLSDADTAGVKPLFREDKDFALSWIKRHGNGRVFYCVFGHIAEPFHDPKVQQFYLDGIQYALGDLEVDDAPKGK